MKSSQARRNCDLEGFRESLGGALYAAYNRIGTLGNGFLAIISEICPANVEDGT